MIHKPIFLKDLNLSFPHKICFQNFSCHIPYGSRIAIIGRNGSGKSSLLKMVGSLCAEDVVVGYVPQTITEHSELSGGERVNKALTEALSLEPNLLLLDEPTNHLDSRNKKSLMRMLHHYQGTLILISHDKALLRHCTDSLWHIENGKVHIFSGSYDDYMREINLRRASLEGELDVLKRQKREVHHKLMQEQQRAAKSKSKGKKSAEQKKWSPIVGKGKAMKAQESSGHKKSAIDKRKTELDARLSALHRSEVITPKFSIDASHINKATLVQISEGAVGYSRNQPLLSGISFGMRGGERIAIAGDNGSGKSTLVKAILGDESIHKTGEWHGVKRDEIGYLDQHYATLNSEKTVLESLSEVVPHWSHAEIRRHLNDFLFRKNEEVTQPVRTLSGGEKARLSLARIAAKTPKLLILDEITNNLDLETKEHVVQVLKAYPGGIIVISHDADFLTEVGMNAFFDVRRIDFRYDALYNGGERR